MAFTPEQKAKVRDCLQEISNSYTRIEAERDLIKDILQRMQDEFEMPKRLSRKVAKIYHKRNIEEEIASNNEVVDTYESVVAKTP